jgi:hypothetical protein
MDLPMPSIHSNSYLENKRNKLKDEELNLLNKNKNLNGLNRMKANGFNTDSNKTSGDYDDPITRNNHLMPKKLFEFSADTSLIKHKQNNYYDLVEINDRLNNSNHNKRINGRKQQVIKNDYKLPIIDATSKTSAEVYIEKYIERSNNNSIPYLESRYKLNKSKTPSTLNNSIYSVLNNLSFENMNSSESLDKIDHSFSVDSNAINPAYLESYENKNYKFNDLGTLVKNTINFNKKIAEHLKSKKVDSETNDTILNNEKLEQSGNEILLQKRLSRKYANRLPLNPKLVSTYDASEFEIKDVYQNEMENYVELIKNRKLKLIDESNSKYINWIIKYFKSTR